MRVCLASSPTSAARKAGSSSAQLLWSTTTTRPTVDNGALRELHAAAAAGDDLFADERLSDDDGVRLQNDDEEISTQSIAHEEGVERVSPESHGEDDREGMEDEKPFDVHDFYEQPAGSLQGAHVVPPYTILDTLLDVDIWRYTFAVAVYDPPKDRFVAL
ncbi:hypothetical protein THAOC_10641, partial [Thalassiosira oceanica]